MHQVNIVEQDFDKIDHDIAVAELIVTDTSLASNASIYGSRSVRK